MNRIPLLSSARKRLRRKLDHIRQRRLDPQSLDADVREKPDAYTVVFDAPGVVHEDIQVRYVDGQVMTRIERFRDSYEGFELTVSERTLSFGGEVALPDDANVSPESGDATLRANGTLRVSVPKEQAEIEEPEAKPTATD